MTPLPVTHKIAAALMAVYGLVALVGGIIGYVKTSNMGRPSYASLIAGSVSGLLLLFCAFGVFRWPFWSLLGAGVIALALLGRFAPKVADGGTTAITMTVGGSLVLIAAVLALATQPRPPVEP